MTHIDNLAYVRGNPDDFEDYNANDRRLLTLGLIGVHYGNSLEVRQLFNSKFNALVRYHSNLWRDRTPQERGFSYYAQRYARFFEDLFRLCEKFPDLHLEHEYSCYLERYRHYSSSIDDFNKRLEARMKAQQELRFQNYLREKYAFFEAHPNLKLPRKCPRCHHHSYIFEYSSRNSGFSYCSSCNYGLL